MIVDNMKDIHIILAEIIDAAKECGKIMLSADRNDLKIKVKRERQILYGDMIVKFKK